MRVRTLGRCRGNGKFYLLLSVSDCDISSLCVTSYSSRGTQLPAYHIPVLQDDRSFQVVLALFGAKVRQVVRLSSGPGQSVELTIHPVVFSVASKINGRIRKKLCADIRNIDSRGLVSGISLSCDLVVPTPNSVIIRGQYAVNEKDAPAIRVHNLQGETIDAPCVLFPGGSSLGDAQVTSSTGTYSVELDNFDETVCLSLWVHDNPVGSCYVLRPFHRKELRERSNNMFENAFSQQGYDSWLIRHRTPATTIEAQRSIRFEHEPLFSVVVPLYKTPLRFFREMADSVLAQSYANWELILVNSTPEEAGLAKLVDQYAGRDDRIRVVTLEKNYGITENTNRGIQVARGEYLCFFDHDDVLEPDILFEYAKAINGDPEINLLYCDEDKLLPDGNFGCPTFKPDFSLDMVRDNNYICHLLTVRRSAYDQIEPSGPELDGAQDHAMVLKISELGGSIHHVPKILYHWRISETSTAGNSDSKPYATTAGILAVQQHLDRVGVAACVECSHGRAFRYLASYGVKDDARVSIIAATRGDKITRCFLEMLSRAEFPNLEVVLVVPSSRLSCMNDCLLDVKGRMDVRCIGTDRLFSYSEWLNLGASKATGDVLVTCHDDIDAVNPTWLKVLAGHALREDVGAVGTMTVSLDGLIQQAGLALVGGSVVNLSSGIYMESPGYIYYPLTTRNVSAVSGVCLAMRRSIFEEMDGFDERYVHSFADIDYCLRVNELGKLVVYTPEAVLRHIARTDSTSDGSGARSAQYYKDRALLTSRWADAFSKGDPFFNPNFSRNPVDAAQYRFDDCGVGNEPDR